MNPTLLKDLILAGHRVACKRDDGEWKVFMFVNGAGDFQGCYVQHSIEAGLSEGLRSNSYTKEEIKENFTGEYKIVTSLPQLPQVGDTVEVLDICRELPDFDEWYVGKIDMIGKKLTVHSIGVGGYITVRTEDKTDYQNFQTRQVAKCEPQKAQSIEPEETFGEIIELNGKKYREII